MYVSFGSSIVATVAAFGDGCFNGMDVCMRGVGEDVWAPGEKWCHSLSSFLSGHYSTVYKTSTVQGERSP